MGRFVNPDSSAFQVALNSRIYVDKTGLIEYTNSVLDTTNAYICNSRPRRFGKSYAANMLAAYYSKGTDSEQMFSGLRISKDADFKKHLNKYDVIHIDIQWFLANCDDADKVVAFITKSVLDELRDSYPEVLPHDEGRITMEKNSSKKGDIKISLLGLLIGISLIVAGVYGIVSNKIENQEYKNSTDIRTVNAVVEECRRKDEKNDADILIRSEYNTKVSFVVDGTTYKGRTYFVFGQNELKNSLPFQDKIRRGDEVSVEVYRTSKGSYKIKPDNDIITFLLCCMAIPVGAVVVIIMVLDIFKHASVKRT